MSILIARSVLETVAKALTDAHDVRVVFYGNECCTDGRTITLPSLPDKIPEDMILMLRGYLDHEVGHIAFTDFKKYRKLPKNKTEQFALNAIEDVRIELEMENIWKGCKVNFERAHDMTVDKLIDPKDGAKWEDHDAVTKVFVLFISAARYGYDTELLSKHSPEFMPILDELADEVDESQNLESTEEAYDLAVRVLDKIEHIAESFLPKMAGKRRKKEKGDMGKGAEGSKAAGSGATGDPSGSGEGVKAPEKGPKGKPDSPDKIAREETGGSDYGDVYDDEDDTEDDPESVTEDDPEEDDSPEDEDDPDEDEEEGPEVDEEILERLKKSLDSDKPKSIPDIGKSISKKVKGLKGYRVLTTEKDIFKEWPGTATGLDEYELYRKKTSGVVGVLKNQLNRLLMSKKRATWTGGRRHGIVNPATLHMAVQRTSDKLFRIRKEGARINTAVSILVDLSGSMGGERMRKATETSVLMAETLALANVPFEILGFSGDNTYSSTRGRDETRFSRYGSLDMFYFKLFNEPLNQKIKRRIGTMRAKQQNYDGESVRFAANRLLAREERKRVLFVLSDGAPCAGYCDGSALSPHLKQVCKELESLPDFYLCAFGIQTEAPKRFYRNHVLIDDLKDLPKVLMESLSRALL